MKNIGFIGVGYMGYGIAKNILKDTKFPSSLSLFIQPPYSSTARLLN